MRPKVSVIVPVYNVEEYLPKCLDSIINGTFKDIEIIVVNDGSTDGSSKILEDYKKKDKRIVVINKENGGLGSARNKGLEKASGEYISFIDSDDWIDKDMLEKMYDKAIREKLDIIVCSYKNIYCNKEEIYTIPDKIINDTMQHKNSRIFNTFSAWCKIYKRDFVLQNKVKFVEEKIWYEDFPFSVKLLSMTSKIGIINEPFYNYLIRNNSIMNNSNIIKNLDLLVAFDDVKAFLEKKNCYQEFYHELEYLAIDNILISGITRIIRASGDKKTKREVTNKFISYLKDNFPNYRNNPYLNYLSRNRKIIYRLILLKQYWIVALIFKIK